MTKNQILTQLYDSRELAAMLSKFNAGAGQEDLKSELFAALCEKEEQMLLDLYNRNQLMYYATAIVQKMVFQTGGRFHRRYRGATYEVSENLLSECTEANRKELEEQLRKLDEAIKNNLHWVEQTVLEIHNKTGSITALSQKTNISRKQLSRILSKAKEKLASAVGGKLMGNYVKATCEVVLDLPDEVTPENINDILEDTLQYMMARLEGRVIPSKKQTNGYIKEIKPLKLKQIV
jgi:hypothetical protein